MLRVTEYIAKSLKVIWYDNQLKSLLVFYCNYVSRTGRFLDSVK